jgi:DNA polymerase elongation subunit (family B)
MLIDLVRIIREKDPDVIEGHNIYNFDLPYILKRCELNDVPLNIGRDGTAPRSFDTRTAFAERTYEYAVTEIAGRHIIDTLLLVQNYDVSKRDMESYGLKYAAQYFGLASSERTYIKGEKISWHWDNDVQPLMDYALDDVTETRKLSDQLSITYFHLAQMLPFNLGQVARMGSASKIESLMVREYVRRKCSIPKPAAGLQTTGGYTDIFVMGILGPIMHVDVESLYPSIMLSKAIVPASDALKAFQELLRALTTLRLEAKRKMKAIEDPQMKSRADALQSSLKILINSFYGYLGYGRGLFNDFTQADVVTRTGQDLLRQMISYIRSSGGKVIEVDTDGIFFVPPEHVRGEEVELEFVHAISKQMPEGITVALDGRYARMLSYKKKNYALLRYDNKIRIKGSSLTSRSMERFGRNYIMQCIDCLLNNNIAGLHTLYTQLYHTISDHKLDVKDFARVETLKDSLTDYTREVDAGKRNRGAAYEVALATGKQIRVGDRVAYYITGNDRNPRSFDNCKPAEEWDPNFPDENTPYYLRRLDEFSEKFKPFFLPQDFRSIFSGDDLFPFSPTGITPLVTDIIDGGPPETSDRPSEIGIWLEE